MLRAEYHNFIYQGTTTTITKIKEFKGNYIGRSFTPSNDIPEFNINKERRELFFLNAYSLAYYETYYLY